MKKTKQFGPSYDEKIDGERIGKQIETIRDYMLKSSWKTLNEIAKKTGYPETSISANLRHLRKREHGAYDVQKERKKELKGTYVYRVRVSEKQEEPEADPKSTVPPRRYVIINRRALSHIVDDGEKESGKYGRTKCGKLFDFESDRIFKALNLSDERCFVCDGTKQSMNNKQADLFGN